MKKPNKKLTFKERRPSIGRVHEKSGILYDESGKPVAKVVRGKVAILSNNPKVRQSGLGFSGRLRSGLPIPRNSFAGTQFTSRELEAALDKLFGQGEVAASRHIAR